MYDVKEQSLLDFIKLLFYAFNIKRWLCIILWTVVFHSVQILIFQLPGFYLRRDKKYTSEVGTCILQTSLLKRWEIFFPHTLMATILPPPLTILFLCVNSQPIFYSLISDWQVFHIFYLITFCLAVKPEKCGPSSCNAIVGQFHIY